MDERFDGSANQLVQHAQEVDHKGPGMCDFCFNLAVELGRLRGAKAELAVLRQRLEAASPIVEAVAQLAVDNCYAEWSDLPLYGDVDGDGPCLTVGDVLAARAWRDQREQGQ